MCNILCSIYFVVDCCHKVLQLCIYTHTLFFFFNSYLQLGAKYLTDVTKSRYWSPAILEVDRPKKRDFLSLFLSFLSCSQLLLNIQSTQIWPTTATRPAGKPEGVTEEFTTNATSTRSKGMKSVFEHQTVGTVCSMRIPRKSLNLDSPSNQDHYTRKTCLLF